MDDETRRILGCVTGAQPGVCRTLRVQDPVDLDRCRHRRAAHEPGRHDRAAALPRSTAASGSRPRRRPAANAAVSASPAPIPHRTSTAIPGSERRPSRVMSDTPSPPCLRTMTRPCGAPTGPPGAGSPPRTRRRCRSSDVAQPGGSRDELGGLAGSGQRVGRQSRSRIVVRRGAGGRGLCAGPRGRGAPSSGRSAARSVPDTTTRALARAGPPAARRPSSCISGAGAIAVERRREVLRRPDLEERDLGQRAGRIRRPDVDPLPREERPDVSAVPVVAHGRDRPRWRSRGGRARSRCCPRNCPRRGRNEFASPSDVRGLRWREVDADSTDDDRLDHRRAPTITPGA